MQCMPWVLVTFPQAREEMRAHSSAVPLWVLNHPWLPGVHLACRPWGALREDGPAQMKLVSGAMGSGVRVSWVRLSGAGLSPYGLALFLPCLELTENPASLWGQEASQVLAMV